MLIRKIELLKKIAKKHRIVVSTRFEENATRLENWPPKKYRVKPIRQRPQQTLLPSPQGFLKAYSFGKLRSCTYRIRMPSLKCCYTGGRHNDRIRYLQGLGFPKIYALKIPGGQLNPSQTALYYFDFLRNFVFIRFESSTSTIVQHQEKNAWVSVIFLVTTTYRY